MTPAIKGIIEQIKTRFTELKRQNVTLTLQNEELNSRLTSVQQEMETLRVDNQSSTEKITLLEQQLAALEAEKQNQEVRSESNKDEEIDFLVKEIDQCINQIKTNL